MADNSIPDEIRKRVEEKRKQAPDIEKFTELIGRSIAFYERESEQIQRENTEKTIRPEIERELEAAIRNRVALIFTWAFVLLLGMVLLYIILRTLFPPYSCTEDTNRQLITILQGTFLPVLTLVLGYFFGSKTRS